MNCPLRSFTCVTLLKKPASTFQVAPQAQKHASERAPRTIHLVSVRGNFIITLYRVAERHREGSWCARRVGRRFQREGADQSMEREEESERAGRERGCTGLTRDGGDGHIYLPVLATPLIWRWTRQKRARIEEGLGVGEPPHTLASGRMYV